jgi:hypothetical protein
MALPDQIKHLRKHPGMHLRVVDYNTVSACIDGFSLAHNGVFLKGFQEWLCKRTDNGHNMGWSTLILFIAFPDSRVPWQKLTAKDADEHAIDVMFALLDEFYANREFRPQITA